MCEDAPALPSPQKELHPKLSKSAVLACLNKIDLFYFAFFTVTNRYIHSLKSLNTKETPLFLPANSVGL